MVLSSLFGKVLACQEPDNAMQFAIAGFHRILAGLRSLSILNPAMVAKTIEMRGQPTSCDKNLGQSTNFTGSPKKPSKSPILMTSSAKFDDLITAVKFF